MNTKNQTLINQMIGLLPMPPVAVALIVATVFVFPLLVVTDLTGSSAAAISQGAWHLGIGPAMIAFILGVHPWLQSRWQAAIDALRPISRQPGLVDEAFMVFDAGAGVALLFGAALGAWISL